MTTNAGAEEICRGTMGFCEQDHTLDSSKVIEKKFAPEFRNRLDAIVQFKPLNKEAVYLIVEKVLAELQGKLNNKRVCIAVDNDARDWLATHGFDKNMGARPMERLIKEVLKKPLANAMLGGDLAQSGGQVKVSVRKGKIKIDIAQTAE
jgi:ATP-dependent Clp protease ATP-binding subunit ClpA